MARIPGATGALYVGVASSTAVPQAVAFINDMSISFKTDKYNVTSFEDGNKTYVVGKEDSQGTFAGFYDNATAQLYTAASDGDPRRFYFYPDRRVGTAGPYWFGTGYFDFEVKVMAEGANSINGSWVAASDITKIG
jgi:hypothetical protein